MTAVLYYDAEPLGGYVEPFRVAYYFDSITMTVLESDDQRVVDFVGNGGTIEPYEAPVAPSDISPEANGDALDSRQRETAKGDVRALLTAGKTKDAVIKLLELL